jgi:hypothetical protein
MAVIQILPDDMPDAIRQRRREARWATALPMRLISGSGESIPAVLRDVSASGILALVDARFSPLLPPPRGSCFEAEFYIDEILVPRVLLEIVRVDTRGEGLIALRCCMVDPPPDLAALLRAKVASRLTVPRRDSVPLADPDS